MVAWIALAVALLCLAWIVAFTLACRYAFKKAKPYLSMLGIADSPAPAPALVREYSGPLTFNEGDPLE